METRDTKLSEKAQNLLKWLAQPNKYIDVCMVFSPKLGEANMSDDGKAVYSRSALQRLIEVGAVRGKLVNQYGVRFERFSITPYGIIELKIRG